LLRFPHVATRWHPLLEAEIKRWVGDDANLAPSMCALFDELSTRLVVADDVRAADSAGELEAFFRLSGDFMLVLDAELHVRHLNTAFQSWGYDVADFRGRSFLELIVEGERESAGATLSSILRTREWVPLATRVRTSTNAVRLVHWQLSTDGEGQRIFLVGRDVTEQERLKEDLSQAQRLEAVAQLAAGVAHEVNTPLQFLSDNVKFFEDSLRDLAPVFELVSTPAPDVQALSEAAQSADVEYLRTELPAALESMRDGVRRVRALVQSLKELAPTHAEAGELAQVDLLPMLRGVIAAQSTGRAGLEVVATLEPLPSLSVQVGAVNRVVVSLIDNALKALERKHGPTGGRLEVRCGVDHGAVFVAISDDGVGIGSEVGVHLFEPFFSTRDVGAGTGQSLAIARKVMERHHGTIDFSSEPGRGATFTLRFPLPVDESLWN
jgi:PAS domain S-box-containing protein